ncbi:hypothetical protein H2198_005642 [Neophaeococcomyces mojaviensis]|uniref:Uncharacterized protein n=1 Tax=Neophaeococcomyces mojaviensis TaxID=3383035 RepID=A0ACC3A5S3_9EURO|nr:hypothetical protein H2198_005642 [Knufia sp. JES_112]
MASSHQSPVMVEQSSPTHTFASPDFALSILSPPTANQRVSSSATSAIMPEPETQEQESSAQDQTPSRSEDVHSSEEQQVLPSETLNDGDDSSNSESNSESSTSTETPGTISTPRSAAQDSGHPVPVSGTTQLSDGNSDEQRTEESASENTPITETRTADTSPPLDVLETRLPPVEVNIPVIDDVPEWVKYEEDTSAPSEEELKEIEADSRELDASSPAAIEKDVFTDIDDPDLRPCKKLRLSWVVKGVRGTREKPNRARIMTSPSVCVDGKYWNIKFFPRGNKSRNSLAAYLRCSPVPPEPSKNHYEGSFKVFEGDAEADLSKCEPILDLNLTLPETKDESSSSPGDDEGKDQQNSGDDTKSQRQDQDQDQDQDQHDESVSGDEDDRPVNATKAVVSDDFRVSAQLGLVIYNPAEPRTCYNSFASHQFYPHQDDWGWDTAVSHWEDIHRRKHGQRQALLRNDTLAIDAYIRIYDDPTKALFWHSSPGESQWDSKGLAGYFPFGTRMLYHSPATAGIAAWTLLAPFRKLIQKADAGVWRKDSAARPRPLIAQLQLVLFQMRHMKKEELYVHIDSVIHEITRYQESFDNVTAFWEAFRRSIELEMDENEEACEALNKMFGSRDLARKLPLLPVENITNFQEGVNQAFAKVGFKDSLPDFLPLTLQRQTFDSKKRKWRLQRDRVRMSEEIDMAQFCTDDDSKFTLYGLVIHEAERSSGKFHSILRPAGPGGKWLTFTDGNGNKVKSYTRKQVEEYEIPEDFGLKRSTEAPRMYYMGLYIRTSRLSTYLPEQLEPFQLPMWLKPYLEESYYHNPDLFEKADEAHKTDEDKSVRIELFWDKLVGGQEGKLDLYRLKSNEKARQKEYRQELTADRGCTMYEVKAKLASILGVEDKAFKIWAMNYYRLGAVSKAYMYVLPNDSIIATCLGSSQTLTLWLAMMPEKYELTEEVLSKNFMGIAGTHVEAPPQPEPEPEPEPEPAPEPVKVSESSAKEDAEVQSSSEPGLAGEVTNATQVDNVSTGSTTLETPTSTTTSATEPVSIPQPASQAGDIALSDESIAAPDAEQASVQESVQRTLENVSSVSNHATQDLNEAQPRNQPVPAQPETHSEEPSTSLEIVQDGEAVSIPSPVHAPELNLGDGPVSPTLDSILAPATAAINSEVQPENTDRVIAIDEQSISGDSTQADELVPPVVHGHLFEAASHEDSSLPLGIPITVGNEQIILIPPNQEDISPEDAALITQMIAADLEASERQVVTTQAQDEEGGSTADEEEIDSRPSTPRQVIADIYGFLHVFDPVNQKFTARGTFSVPRDTAISAMVKKQLGYDEDRAFQLWKRDGTFRTTGVSLESTFMDVSLTDCCEVIVGDHIGELKIEALKAEAKFVDPGHLMRHMMMVQRKHPILSATTDGPVELAEFGGDYYKGPLVNGQRHGKMCSLITQSGDTYEGPLVSGQKSGGKGKMIYQNGDVYDGEWLDDQKHGQGEFIEKRTGNRYVGGYENDKRWGKGVTYWEVADQQAALCQVCYFEEVDALFYKCGHVVACFSCAKQCASDSAGCPVCRKPIEAVVKMYRS